MKNNWAWYIVKPYFKAKRYNKCKLVIRSMLELLRNGDCGGIRPGMSRDELHKLLGLPSLWRVEEDIHLAKIWRYGDVEFHFINNPNSVTFIYTDHNDLTGGGSTLKIDPWIIRGDLTRHELEYSFRKIGIGFTNSNRQMSKTKSIASIVTETGVSFAFLEKSGDHLLQSFLDCWCWSSQCKQN